MPRYGCQWAKIFDNIWKRYQQSHDTPRVKVTPHICRHTYATDMAIKGMNPIILKEILGHDDISTIFSIYTHIKESDSVAELQKLELINMDNKAAGKMSARDNSKIIDFTDRIA